MPFSFFYIISMLFSFFYIISMPFQGLIVLRVRTSLPLDGLSMGREPPGAIAKLTWSTYPWIASSNDFNLKGD